MASAIPVGLRSITPQLVAVDAKALLDFVEQAFGAERPFPPMTGPDGTILHAHVRIGDSVVFVSQAGGFAEVTHANLFLYVAEVDQSVARAVRAGARLMVPVSDVFWGDRWGMIADPFGNTWQVATHGEDVPPEEMMRRISALPSPR